MLNLNMSRQRPSNYTPWGYRCYLCGSPEDCCCDYPTYRETRDGALRARPTFHVRVEDANGSPWDMGQLSLARAWSYVRLFVGSDHCSGITVTRFWYDGDRACSRVIVALD